MPNDPMEAIEREINEAILQALAKYATSGYSVGLEFHGELRGILQDIGHPETGTGWGFKIGNGLPPGWPSLERPDQP